VVCRKKELVGEEGEINRDERLTWVEEDGGGAESDGGWGAEFKD